MKQHNKLKSGPMGTSNFASYGLSVIGSLRPLQHQGRPPENTLVALRSV